MLSLVSAFLGFFVVLLLGFGFEGAVPFGLLTYAVMFSLLNLYSRKDLTIGISMKSRLSYLWNLLPYILWGVSLVALIALKPSHFQSSFVPWSKIDMVSWILRVASMLVFLFFPGFAVLQIINSNKTNGRLTNLLLSIHISMAVNSLVMAVGTLSGNPTFGTSLVLGLNIGLYIFSVILFFLKKETLKHSHDRVLIVNEPATLVLVTSIILIYLVSIGIFYYPSKFVVGYDHWDYYKRVISISGGQIGEARSGAFLWELLVSGIVSSSGLPSLNSYMTMFPLLILPVLSFYLMTTHVVGGKLSSIATLIFSLFSGLGGFYSMYLIWVRGLPLAEAVIVTSEKTIDLTLGVQYNILSFHPQNFALSTVFIMILLLHRDVQIRRAKWLILPLLFAFTFWLHAIVAMLFLIVLPLVTFLYGENLIPPKSLVAIIGLGCILSTLVSLCPVGETTLVSRLPFTASYLPPLVLASLGFIFVSKFVRLRACYLIGAIPTKVKKLLIIATVITALAFCFGGVLLWLLVNNPPLIGGGISWWTPWYFYPVKLGLPLLLSVLSLLLWKKDEYKRLLLLGFSLAIIPIIVARFFHYSFIMNIVEFPYDESRMLSFSRIGLALIGAPIIAEALKRIRINPKYSRGYPYVKSTLDTKSTLVLLGVLVLLFGGLSSGLLTFSGHSFSVFGDLKEPYTLRYGDLQGADLLSKDFPIDRSVLSVRPLQSLVGHFSTATFVDLGEAAALQLRTADPIFFLLANAYRVGTAEYKKPGALAVAKPYSSDNIVQELEPKSYLFWLTDYLDIIFENDRMVLYKMPNFSLPTNDSDIALLITQERFLDQDYTLAMVASSRVNYSAYAIDDIKTYSHGPSTIIASSSSFRTVSEKLTEWVKEGGNLVFINGSTIQDVGKGVILAEDEQTEFWTPDIRGPGIVGIPTISNDHLTKASGESSLKVDIPSGSYDAILTHQFQPPADWSSLKILSMYIHGANKGESISIELYTSNETIEDRFRYQITDNWVGWRRIDIPVDSFEAVGSPDISSVSKIVLVFRSPATYRVDQINLYFEYQPTPTQGDQIVTSKIVSDSDKVELPLIELQAFTQLPPGAEPIAFYSFEEKMITPFAYKQQLGQGELIYVDANPIFRFIWTKRGSESARAVFMKLGAIFELIGLKNIKQPNVLEGLELSALYGTAQLTNVRVEADSFVMPSISKILCLTELGKGSVEMSSRIDSLTISNLVVSSLEVKGKYRVIFEAYETIIEAPGFASYSRFVFPAGFNLSVILSDQASMKVSFASQDGPLNVTIMGGQVTFSTKNNDIWPEVFMQNAKVYSVGSSQFSAIWISEAYGVRVVPTEVNDFPQLKVAGAISFRITGMDNFIALLSEVSIQGKIEVTYVPE